MSLVAFTIRAQQSDYYVRYGEDVNVTHGTHYPIMVGVSNVRDYFLNSLLDKEKSFSTCKDEHFYLQVETSRASS